MSDFSKEYSYEINKGLYNLSFTDPTNLSYPRRVFEAIINKFKGKKLGNAYYIKLFWVFHWDFMAIGADWKSFEVLGNSNFAKDKKHVYWTENKLINVDRDSFVPLGHNYAKDKNKVYRTFITLEDADPKAIELLNGDYAKDKQYVYFSGKKIQGCEASSFEILDITIDLSRDSKHVFYKEKLIKEADPVTFQRISKTFFPNPTVLETAYRAFSAVYKIPPEVLNPEKIFYYEEQYPPTQSGPERRYKIEDWEWDFAFDKNKMYFKEKLLGNRNPEIDRILENGDITH